MSSDAQKSEGGFCVNELGPLRQKTEEEISEWGTAIPAPAIAAAVAQLVEHVLGKDEVIGSSPISSSCAAWCVAYECINRLPKMAKQIRGCEQLRQRNLKKENHRVPLGNFS